MGTGEQGGDPVEKMFVCRGGNSKRNRNIDDKGAENERLFVTF